MKNNPLKFENNKLVEEKIEGEKNMTNLIADQVSTGIKTASEKCKELVEASIAAATVLKETAKCQLTDIYDTKLSRKSKKQVDSIKNKLELAKHVSKYWIKNIKSKFD